MCNARRPRCLAYPKVPDIQVCHQYYNAYNHTYMIQIHKAYLLDVTLSCLNPFDTPSVPFGCALPLIQNRILPILETVTTDSGRNEIWLITADSRSLF